MLTWAEDNESRGSLKLWRAGTSSTSTEMLEMVRRRLFPAVLYYNILPEYLPRQARDKHLTKQGHVSTGSAKNATFCAIYILKKRTFCQDRLGTNMGKSTQKRLVAFCAGSVVCAARRDHFEHDDRLRRHGFHPSSDKRTLDAKGKACARWCEKRLFSARHFLLQPEYLAETGSGQVYYRR